MVNFRSINRLLIVSVLFSTLMPAHYHVHHLHDVGADAHDHDHAIDLHFIAADVDQSHHDEDTSIFATTPDVIVKKLNIDVPTHLLLTILLILVTVIYRVSIRHKHENDGLYQKQAYFTPPLRAPPA